MLDRLKRVKNQYEELMRRMEEPETYSDPALYARCDREARELRPLAEAFAAFEKAENDMEGARELMNDPEMRELAQEEYQQARAERDRLERIAPITAPLTVPVPPYAEAPPMKQELIASIS